MYDRWSRVSTAHLVAALLCDVGADTEAAIWVDFGLDELGALDKKVAVEAWDDVRELTRVAQVVSAPARLIARAEAAKAPSVAGRLRLAARVRALGLGVPDVGKDWRIADEPVKQWWGRAMEGRFSDAAAAIVRAPPVERRFRAAALSAIGAFGEAMTLAEPGDRDVILAHCALCLAQTRPVVPMVVGVPAPVRDGTPWHWRAPRVAVPCTKASVDALRDP